MKKLFVIILLCCISLLASAQGMVPKMDEPIMKDGVSIVSLPRGIMMIPFYCSANGKIGFARNSSHPTVIVEPKFDDAETELKPIIAVCIGGKWGAVDAALKYSHYDEQPFIKCVYNNIDEVREVIKRYNKL